MNEINAELIEAIIMAEAVKWPRSGAREIARRIVEAFPWLQSSSKPDTDLRHEVGYLKGELARVTYERDRAERQRVEMLIENNRLRYADGCCQADLPVKPAPHSWANGWSG